MGSVRSQSTLASAPLFKSQAASASIPGRATFEGTKQFVLDSEMSLFHHFSFSDLIVTPVIHGAPSLFDADNQRYIETLTTRAVLKNRSNCIVVYEHQAHKHTQASSVKNTTTSTDSDILVKPYYVGNLGAVLREGKLSREQIVTVASIGMPAKVKEVLRRMQEAKALTKLEFIEMAYFELDDHYATEDPSIVQETVEALTHMIRKGDLLSFGIKLSISPYKFHNPPPPNASKHLMGLPEAIEAEMSQGMQGCDMIIYPISPSIVTPSTYPMLEANSELWKDKPKDKVETDRKITRVAADPLTIKRGLGLVSNPSDEYEIELISGFNEPRVEEGLASSLNLLCPQLESTPRLQDKALRVVLSADVDAFMVDAECSGFMGKFSLTPEDALSSDDTEIVFGVFGVPMPSKET